ncbi:MAG: twin-arginine translocase TatA/TatE family subunit [Gammaproteobacteria bacterium]|nr:twin-arginine translocase TatA/TatE family subunit [Gammaproteobacteria bacterium]
MRFGIPELLIILVICVLLFGSKRLRSLGGDLAGFVKGLRSGLKDPEEPASGNDAAGGTGAGRIIDGQPAGDREKTSV